MGNILDEFEFILAEEPEDTTTFIDDSNEFIAEAHAFIKKMQSNTKSTYQGIKGQNIVECISIGKTDIMPWDHVTFTLDIIKLRNIGNNKLEDFVIPPFIEELCSTGDKGILGFGYNNTGHNFLKHITIPSSVVVIAPNTFTFYKRLESIIFEERSKLMYLGDQAFVGCESLHTLNLTSCRYLDKIYSNTFSASGITKLKLPNTIEIISPLSSTSIEQVYIDEDAYTISEFNTRVAEKQGAFWGDIEGYNF